MLTINQISVFLILGVIFSLGIGSAQTEDIKKSEGRWSRYGRPCTGSYRVKSHGKCICKERYYEHDNRCYASRDQKCNTSEDCASIWLNCISGTCKRFSPFNSGEISTKPGATASLEGKYFSRSLITESSYFNASTSKEVGDPGNLAWTKDFTLDRVVAVHTSVGFSVWCRIMNSTGEFVLGEVHIDDDEKLCDFYHEGQKFSTEDFEVYVDLGPEN